MRYPQPQGTKGSLKWIQALINNHPSIINEQLSTQDINWISPLESDDYAEYRDSTFLELLNLGHLKLKLKDFWPSRGPQWDALGKAGEKILLVEAKANIPEISSSCGATSPKSIAKIEKAIHATQVASDVTDGNGWLNGYYQYANRLAHLHFFTNICKIEAELVFIYFCNDPTHIPTLITDWRRVVAEQKRMMGIATLDNVSELFIDCQGMIKK